MESDPEKIPGSFQDEILQTLRKIAAAMTDVSQGKRTPTDFRRDFIFQEARLKSSTFYLQNRVQFAIRRQLEDSLLKADNLPLQAYAAIDYIQSCILTMARFFRGSSS